MPGIEIFSLRRRPEEKYEKKGLSGLAARSFPHIVEGILVVRITLGHASRAWIDYLG